MDTVFERARGFICRNARPLDFARWRYHFENGGREDVLSALSGYQNADGGFGHALEADSWNPDSSPLQTWAATEILREIGWTDGNHPLVQGILRYLESKAYFDGRHWPFCVPGNNDFPHAPWWTFTEGATDDDNPTAALAGFIVRFAVKGSALYDFGHDLAKRVYETFSALETIREMHTLICYDRMLEYLTAAGEPSIVDLNAFREKMRRHVQSVITKDTETWKTGYVCRPSRFVVSRDSAYFADNRALALYECDFLRDTQLPDGSWIVTWDWQSYDEQWHISKNWWKSSIILENLLYLKGMES